MKAQIPNHRERLVNLLITPQIERCLVKILIEALKAIEPAMIDSLHEQYRVGASTGVRDWDKSKD